MKSKPYKWRIEDPNDVAALEIEACDEGGGPYLVLRTDGDFGLCSFEEIDALAADLRKMLSDAGAKEDAPSMEAKRDELSPEEPMDPDLAVWDCKIGWEDRRLLPPGCDGPMRQAVRRAFVELVGKEPDFIFSGWGGSLTEHELAVVEKRKRKQAGGGAR